jgi:hypothetical protein
MKTSNLALVAGLVGAIALAPTQLSLAQAETRATSSASATTVSTKQFGAVAGSSPSATTAAAYSVPAFTSGCAFSNNTDKKAKFPKSNIEMASVTGYVVGMELIGAGFQSGTRITVVDNTGQNSITISLATNADIENNTSIVARGCWQQYFSVNNIYNTDLTSFGIQQSFTSISPDTIAMQHCSGTWTESSGACSGTITTIVSGTSTSAVTTASLALAASGGTTRLRLSATKSGSNVTISISVRRATDVAAGSESNS